MPTRREVIGVLGSGQEEHRAWVEPLARWIATQGFHLLTGAGGGVMRAAAEAFVAVEGRAGLPQRGGGGAHPHAPAPQG